MGVAADCKELCQGVVLVNSAGMRVLNALLRVCLSVPSNDGAPSRCTIPNATTILKNTYFQVHHYCKCLNLP